jgi:hypothetical protein
MLLPTTTVRAPYSATGGSRSFSAEYLGEVGSSPRVYAPVFISSHISKLPSYFHQYRRGKGNNVLHAKVAGVLLKGDTYRYFIGRAKTTYSREGRTRYWTHDYHNGLTYIITVMSYYDRGYIDTYVELSMTKYDGSTGRDYRAYSSDVSLRMSVTKTSHYISGFQSFGMSTKDQEWVKTATLSCHPDFDQRYDLREQEIADSIMDLFLSYHFDDRYFRVFGTPLKELENLTLDLPSDLETAFLIGEPEYVLSGYLVGPDAYWLGTLTQGAFMAMIDNMPTLNDNSLSNVAGLCSLLKSIIIDHKPKIPSSLSDAWLAYRYSYTTTKLDVKEAINFAKRVSDGALGRDLQLYGTYSIQYRDVTMTCRCTGVVRQRELGLLSKITNALFQFGLSPSFYVIWDSIPYSFIVDWFIPVGNILHEQDNFIMYTRNYDFTDMWYSISYDSYVGDNPAHVYTRWQGQVPDCYHGYYSLANKGTTSNRTIGFRILDVLSIAFR